VKAEGKDYKITADSVDFDISSGDISASGGILMEGKAFDVEGSELRVDPEQKVKVSNGVKATFRK
jgi:lipopolysaccharide assembly outer membrane protein LptD (OstA)